MNRGKGQNIDGKNCKFKIFPYFQPLRILYIYDTVVNLVVKQVLNRKNNF